MIHNVASIPYLSSHSHFFLKSSSVLIVSCTLSLSFSHPAHNLLLIANMKVLVRVMAMVLTPLLPLFIAVNPALHNVCGRVTLSFHGNAILIRNCFENSSLLLCSLIHDMQDLAVKTRNLGDLQLHLIQHASTIFLNKLLWFL